MASTTPRTRHLRHGQFDRLRYSEKGPEFYDERATTLADTGADTEFASGIQKATGTLTLTANAGEGDTVTIDDVVYTFQAELTDVAGNVHIGADADGSIDNLIAAITAGAGGGTAYAASTTEHPTVTASAGTGDTMTVTAKTHIPEDGEAITTVADLTGGDFGAATLGSALNALTATDHGWATGDGPFTVASDDTLPAGLEEDQWYWVRVLDDDTFQLCRTRGRTALPDAYDLISDAGTGTHTATRVETADAIHDINKRVHPTVIAAADDIDDL